MTEKLFGGRRRSDAPSICYTGWTTDCLLPRWVARLAYALGWSVRMVWLWICAPMGAIALLGVWIATHR